MLCAWLCCINGLVVSIFNVFTFVMTHFQSEVVLQELPDGSRTTVPYARESCVKRIPLTHLWSEDTTVRVWMDEHKVQFCRHIVSTGKTTLTSFDDFPPEMLAKSRAETLKVCACFSAHSVHGSVVFFSKLLCLVCASSFSVGHWRRRT